MGKCKIEEHDYKNPIRKGRANYRCRICDEDITLDLVYMAQAKDEFTF